MRHLLPTAAVVLLAACLDFSPAGKTFKCDDGGRCGPGGGAGGSGGSSGGAGGAAGGAAGGGATALFFKASDTAAGAEVGLRVALSRDGRTLAVSGKGTGDGAAYVFGLDGGAWVFEARLEAVNRGLGDSFATALALSADGTVLVAGAPNEDGSGTSANPASDEGKPNSGAAYVFDRGPGGWAQTAYLKGFDSDPHDAFGAAVAVSDDGNVLGVGAPREAGVPGDSTVNTAPESGCVWVIRRMSRSMSWAIYQYVKPSGSAPGDRFGSSVALSADATTLAAGAPERLDAGVAFVFVRTGGSYTQQASLADPAPEPGAELGRRVALSASGSTLAAGAPFRDGPGGNGAGAVLVFERSFNVWAAAPEVLVTGEPGFGFGRSLALSAGGDVLAAGDPTASSAGPATGAAWVFVKGAGWERQPVVLAPNAGEHDDFGSDVALSADGGLLLVGAARDDAAGTGTTADPAATGAEGSGAAWLFTR